MKADLGFWDFEVVKPLLQCEEYAHASIASSCSVADEYCIRCDGCGDRRAEHGAVLCREFGWTAVAVLFT